MSVRSLNKAVLIGNLTRDPELRYTPAGTAVCSFGVATNRQWTTQTGETKEDTEFHRIVAWNKLGELCAQLLTKGRKVYVEGRLSTRSWTAQDGTQRTTTEIVIDDMIILDSKRPLRDEPQGAVSSQPVTRKDDVIPEIVEDKTPSVEPKNEEKDRKTARKSHKSEETKDTEKNGKEEGSVTESPDETITADDIPF